MVSSITDFTSREGAHSSMNTVDMKCIWGSVLVWYVLLGDCPLITFSIHLRVLMRASIAGTVFVSLSLLVVCGQLASSGLCTMTGTEIPTTCDNK